MDRLKKLAKEALDYADEINRDTSKGN
jgi:hypothetical protein